MVPPDADRSELLQALRRLAALPDESESPNEPSGKTEADAQKSPKQESQPPHVEKVNTFDVHSAFERMAERRGLSDDTAEIKDGTRFRGSTPKVRQVNLVHDSVPKAA